MEILAHCFANKKKKRRAKSSIDGDNDDNVRNMVTSTVSIQSVTTRLNNNNW
jgi:enoyl-[acyl-carrier-protein] reductase (NADH)